jgi:hypothetical protein
MDEDDAVIVDSETTVGTMAAIATMIRNTPTLTATWTIPLPKTVAFSNDSTAKQKSDATTVESPVIYGLNAKHDNTASKCEIGSKNKATRLQCQIRRHPSPRRLHLCHSTGWQPETEITFD